MCRFITVTVNEDVELAAFRNATSEAFASLANPFVTSQPPKGTLYFVHRGQCDCGSAIGMASRRAWEPYSEEEVRALSAKGRSPAKLERWKQRRVKAYEKAKPSARDVIEVRGWLEMAGRVLSLPSAKRFGFMHHWYSGRIDSEDLRVAVAQRRSIEDASENDLLELAEDTLLEFER